MKKTLFVLSSITLFVVLTISSLAQMLKPVAIADTGYEPSISMDRHGHIHLAYTKNGCWYGVYDSLWRTIRKPYAIFTSANPGMYTHEPSVVAAENKVMIGFETYEIGLDLSSDIYVKLASSDGDTLGPFSSPRPGYTNFSPCVVLLRDSTFLVTCSIGSGGGQAIHGSLYQARFVRPWRLSPESTLVTVGNDMVLSDTDPVKGYAMIPHLSANAKAKTFAMVYLNGPDNGNRVLARVFTNEGVALSHSFPVSDSMANAYVWSHEVIMKDNGEFVIAWAEEMDTIPAALSYSHIYIRAYYPDGAPKGDRKKINTENFPDVSTLKLAMDSDNRYLLVWMEWNGSHDRAVAQRFNAVDELIGDNFSIADTTDSKMQANPSVVIRNGFIYTAWIDSDSRIWANILDFDNPMSSVPDRQSRTPLFLELWQNYPNPFNPTTTIAFSLDRRDHVTLLVFDLLGREVMKLADENYAAGVHAVQWDGRNNQGSQVSSGIYFIRLRTSSGASSEKKAVLLR